MADSHQAERHEHKPNASEAPKFTYTPTPSDFDAMKLELKKGIAEAKKTLAEQKSAFHDGEIVGIDKVIAGLKPGQIKLGHIDKDEVAVARDKTKPGVGSALLTREDGSTDMATFKNGKVTEETLNNQLGGTTRKYGADGKLKSEDHMVLKPTEQDSIAIGPPEKLYSDHIEYAKGKPVKVHKEEGQTTLDDELQKDGSWKKTLTVKGSDGDTTDTVITFKGGATYNETKKPNGDYEKVAKDRQGNVLNFDVRITDPKSGTTTHKFLDKNGLEQTERLFKI